MTDAPAPQFFPYRVDWYPTAFVPPRTRVEYQRQYLRIICDPTTSRDALLDNGLTVGEYCIWYINWRYARRNARTSRRERQVAD